MATLTKKQLKQQAFQDLDAYESENGASFVSRSEAIKKLLRDPSVFEEERAKFEKECSKRVNRMTNKVLANRLDCIVWDDDQFKRFFRGYLECQGGEIPYDDLCTEGLIDEWRSTYE